MRHSLMSSERTVSVFRPRDFAISRPVRPFGLHVGTGTLEKAAVIFRFTGGPGSSEEPTKRRVPPLVGPDSSDVYLLVIKVSRVSCAHAVSSGLLSKCVADVLMSEPGHCRLRHDACANHLPASVLFVVTRHNLKQSIFKCGTFMAGIVRSNSELANEDVQTGIRVVAWSRAPRGFSQRHGN